LPVRARAYRRKNGKYGAIVCEADTKNPPVEE
jgi:hypothetical protein